MTDELPTRLDADDGRQRRRERPTADELEEAVELTAEGAQRLQQVMDHHDRWNFTVRGETPHQRLDRNYAEILQEVRVAQVGVQFLLAFLLTIAFTPRFGTFTELQKHIYVVSLVLGATATALLIAPAPFHRLVFQRRLKHKVVKVSNYFALCGLMVLMFTLASSLLLILDVVLGTRTALWTTSGIVLWFGLWWYAVPLWCRGPYGPRISRRLLARRGTPLTESHQIPVQESAPERPVTERR